ncbi:MAG: glycoside hydrolase family 36 protein, partial [Terriglobia bacterium]
MWKCASRREGQLFERVIAGAETSIGSFQTSDPHLARNASALTFQDGLGRGAQALWQVTDRRSGLDFHLAVKLYDRFAGLRIDCSLRNAGTQMIHLDHLVPVKGRVVGRNGSNAGPLRVLANGFISWDYAHAKKIEPAEAVRSYDSVAVSVPPLVAGFLSAKSAYGTFDYGFPWSKTPTLQGRAEFNIPLPAGQTREADPLFILFPEDVLKGLEDYATAVEHFNKLRPKHYTNTAWCSWYAGYGRARQANLDALERAVIENAKLMTPLVPLGVDTLRVVDDSNSERFGDWNFPFVPHGMANLARRLRAMGRKPGVWLAPAFVSETSNVFKQHPDWLQRYSDGELITWKNFYGNTMHFFDASNPAVLEYLRQLFTRIRNWGYEYVMIDFMYLFGISDHYTNPRLTRAQIYRGALEAIRDALGQDIYLLGCGAPQLASAGLVDGMRIG